jgi:hypothetical protein
MVGFAQRSVNGIVQFDGWGQVLLTRMAGIGQVLLNLIASISKIESGVACYSDGWYFSV